MAETLKKKDTPVKLYKISEENSLFLNKDKIYVAQRRMKVSYNEYFYWIAKTDNEAVTKNRFLRQELLVLNWIYLLKNEIKFDEKNKKLKKFF